MNKAYKVVFNKVRGTMMVVNEATSSIQKKGAKTVIAAAATAMLAGVSSITVAAPIIDANTQFRGNGTFVEWSGDGIPEGLNSESFTVTGSQATKIAGINSSNQERNSFAILKTVSGATGSAQNLTIDMKAQGPKSAPSQDKQILTVFHAGGHTKLEGNNTTLSVNSDFIGGGNNSLTGIYGQAKDASSSMEISSDTLTISLTSTATNGKSVYGVSTAGGKILLNSKNTTITLDSSTERSTDPNAENQYSEVIGINSSRFDGYGGSWAGYIGSIESNTDSVITVNVTSQSEKPTIKNANSDFGGGSPAIGIKSEGGGLNLLGTNTVNATANGADAYGVNIVNYFYNSTLQHQNFDSSATINNLTVVAKSQTGKAYGVYAKNDGKTNNKVTLTLTGDVDVSATSNSRVYGIYADGKASILAGEAGSTINVTTKGDRDRAVWADLGGTINLIGSTINVNAQGEGGRALQSSDGGVLNVGNDKTERVVASGDDAAIMVLAEGSQVNVTAKEIVATSTGTYGIHVGNNTDKGAAPANAASVTLNANRITVNGSNLGLSAFSHGQMNVSGNLTVTANHAIDARGNATVNINTKAEDSQYTTVLNGDIVFETPAVKDNSQGSGYLVDAFVNVNLNGEKSAWSGRSFYEFDNTPGVTIPVISELHGSIQGFKLQISDGAKWNATGDSFVNTLTMNNGSSVQQATGSTVDILNVDKLNVTGANNVINLPNATMTVITGMDVNGALALNVKKLAGTSTVKEGGSLVVDRLENIGNLTVESGGSLTIGTKIDNNGTVNLESGSTVNALLTGADLSGGSFSLINGGTFNNYGAKLADNAVYDIDWADSNDGTITVKVKSAEAIVQSLPVTTQQAGTVAAILPTLTSTTSAPAPVAAIADAISIAAQTGNGDAVAQIAEDLAPSTAPVVSSVSQGVNNAIAGVANARMAANRAAGDVFTGGSAWAQMIYNSADQDATKKTAKLESDTYGITVGIDGKIGDNLTIGAGFGVTKTDAESGTRDIDVDSYALFGYTEYNADNGWFVNGMVNAIRGRYEENKAPAGVKLTAKYQTTVLGAGVATGYHFENGISPEVGLRYLRTHQGSYNDGAQKIHTDGTNLLTASIGAKYEKAFEQGDWVLKPSARVAATYDVVSDDTESAIRVIGGGQYHVISAHQKRAAYEAGIGLEASNGDWDFSVSYNGEFRSHFQSHTGMLKAKYNF